MKGWLCACRANNGPEHDRCEGCGTLRPRVALRESEPSRCPFDGEPLAADGFCARGAGYPIDRRCALACPYCRQPLEWSGACLACHGSRTPSDRRTWTMPGDRYELDHESGGPRGDGRHWVWVVAGPRAGSRPEDHREALAGVMRIVDVGAVADARLVEPGPGRAIPRGTVAPVALAP